MAEEETLTSTITSAPAYAPPDQIIYPGGTKKPAAYPTQVITAVLEREAPQQLPPIRPFVPLPKLPAAAKRAFALDIETTGVNPWDSRLICIGVKNLREPDSPIEVLFDVDEKKLVEKFVNYMKAHEPEVIVGWGIGFDYKFLFYKLMFYRKECKEWFDAEFYDLMDLFRKGTERNIYTLQKPDKLEDAAKYLLQMKKKMTYEEILLAWQKKEYEKIIKYNENDVKIIEGLWLLSQYAMGRFPELKIEEV